MKVAVAANTLAESATTTSVPYVDVHETHTGVVVLAGRRLPGEYPYGARPVPGEIDPSGSADGGEGLPVAGQAEPPVHRVAAPARSARCALEDRSHPRAALPRRRTDPGCWGARSCGTVDSHRSSHLTARNPHRVGLNHVCRHRCGDRAQRRGVLELAIKHVVRPISHDPGREARNLPGQLRHSTPDGALLNCPGHQAVQRRDGRLGSFRGRLPRSCPHLRVERHHRGKGTSVVGQRRHLRRRGSAVAVVDCDGEAYLRTGDRHGDHWAAVQVRSRAGSRNDHRLMTAARRAQETCYYRNSPVPHRAQHRSRSSGQAVLRVGASPRQRDERIGPAR
jgi:hypothetical protein